MKFQVPVAYPLSAEFSISPSEIFRKISASGHSFCLYRLPYSDDCFLAAGPLREADPHQKLKNDFLVRPFGGHKIFSIKIEISSGIKPAALPDFLPLWYKDAPLTKGINKTGYIQLVAKALKEIEEGRAEKIVLSRCQTIKPAEGFSAARLFETLVSQYPAAFVCLLSCPQFGTWIGASPELLLKKEGRKVETLALAGTKANTSESHFTQKEVLEQAFVTDYIKKRLQKWTGNLAVHGPELQTAGHLKHLATHFTAEINNGFHLLNILEELHPTPAVGGLAAEAAMKFILENEQYHRELYSGYLGPVSDDSGSVYVNLRCMQVFREEAVLYAGGGIVKGSSPEKEWEETEQKMNTLLRFLPHQKTRS